MDTLSSVTSLNLPSLQPPPPKSFSGRRLRPSATASAAAGPPKSSYVVSLKPTDSSLSFTHKNPNFPGHVSFSCVKPKSHRTHEKAASGYAAALVSVCQSKNCLGRTRGDVVRLAEFLEGEGKGEGVKELVMERGEFGKYMKGLVKMLAERGRLGILGEVLEEFERICDELVVWVSS
ncbi:PREDICTED: uncharacterized protein LOC104801361 [Tarenaya hassleriana]|uniref:uncharacterized protein LOC104801361 n=1 Tax=Tarenaya hassleriana TaxID=28532 RepID=UPI00053C0825|nr:PREDICTED: uncharacterized protein LOC104801361 [Tarenaya hassleriana]